MNPSKQVLFSRQITLSEIGKSGQEKLQNASVLIVGCGGLGSPIAVYLASSGVGKIHLVDFDNVDASNLHRQVFYTLADVGKPKAELLAKFIKDRAPFTQVNYSNTAVTKENIFDFIKGVDIVIDGTDSLPTKYLINDACVLRNKPLVYGSLYKFDGYVATFNILQEDGTYTANLRDAFPEITSDIPNCEEAGTLNAIVGVVAIMQVNEVLKLLTKVGKPLVNKLLIYDALENKQLKMQLTSTFGKDKIVELFEKESYFDASCELQDKHLQISPRELQSKLQDKNLEIIAVLPNLKLPFKVHKTIPIDQFNAKEIPVDFSKTYVMVCQKGLNSYKATKMMKEEYPNLKVLNLTGGISSYA